jgi:hypothetical protein
MYGVKQLFNSCCVDDNAVLVYFITDLEVIIATCTDIFNFVFCSN